MHARGFTKHASSGLPEHTRGTYAGVIEKIPYLKELGITAVELLPVFQFDALGAPCWTYQRLGLHASGIEVILDVVFNHTAEGDQNGPTIIAGPRSVVVL
jgi:isoamylase